MKVPTDIIQKQKDIDDFIKSIERQLQSVSMKKHRALNEISNVRLDDEGVSFIASGHCWGNFEDSFYVKWTDLN